MGLAGDDRVADLRVHRRTVSARRFGGGDGDVVPLRGTRETVDYLTSRGEKVGVLKVRLYRPFDVERFAKALPPSIDAIAVLDRRTASQARLEDCGGSGRRGTTRALRLVPPQATEA
jgi:hypothetical protein